MLRKASTSILIGLIIPFIEASLKGHLEPFGQQSLEPQITIDEVNEMPSPKTFFQSYVFKNRPLIMRGAAKTSLAWTKWSDEYFMINTPASPQGDVYVERRKKEIRLQKCAQMRMSTFVASYNYSEIYMKDELPYWLKPDVVMPAVLQCEDLKNDGFDDNTIWFSSGGTASVVHQDKFDNVNCIYRGTKTFVFIDPFKYQVFVPQIITQKDGLFNDKIDVDRIDLEKYPVFSKVQYQIGHIQPGDCIYIPKLWIHQVRSFNDSNLAVNIWWDSAKISQLNLNKCSKKMDFEFTLDKVFFLKSETLDFKINQLRKFRNMLKSRFVNNHSVRLTEFIDYSVEGCPSLKRNNLAITGLIETFQSVDKNHDDVLDSFDFDEEQKDYLYYSRLWQAGEKFNKQMNFFQMKDPINCKGDTFFKNDEADGRQQIKLNKEALRSPDFSEFNIDSMESTLTMDRHLDEEIAFDAKEFFLETEESNLEYSMKSEDNEDYQNKHNEL